MIEEWNQVHWYIGDAEVDDCELYLEASGELYVKYEKTINADGSINWKLLDKKVSFIDISKIVGNYRNYDNLISFVEKQLLEEYE